MPTLMNISGDDANQVILDAEKISVVTSYDSGKIYVMYDSAPVVAFDPAEKNTWKIDLPLLLKTMEEKGLPLVSFPIRHDGRKVDAWISPRHVSYITTSAPDENDGMMGAIVGLKNYGRHETYGVTKAELNTLIDAVEKSGKTLMSFTPNEAHARWMRADRLLIDAQEITVIYGDGSRTQLNTGFGNAGSLDIQTPDRAENSLTLTPEQSEALKTGQKTEEAILWECERRREEETRKERLTLAQKLADAHGSLTALSEGNIPVFLNPATIWRASTYDETDPKRQNGKGYNYRLSLEIFSGEKEKYPTHISVYFKTTAARQTAIETLKKPKAPKNIP